MELRPYQSSDLARIVALDQICFSARFRFSRAMMRRVVEAPGAVVLLACRSGTDGAESLLGFCAVQFEQGSEGRGYGYVATLDVSPGERGRGVGRALMHAVEQSVLEHGGRGMLLHVFVENTAAVRLYERLGYARVRREVNFYGPGFDAWVYGKELSA